MTDEELRRQLTELSAVDRSGMVPGFRQLLPQIVVSGILPVATYAVIHPHMSDTVALSLIAIFPVGQSLWDRVRHGKRDPISLLVLAGIAIGIAASLLLNGSTLLLKIRESAFTGFFGLTCLVSLTFRRPLMFVIGKDFATGGDPEKQEAFEAQWALPGIPRRFRFVTAVWGVSLVAETVVRVFTAVLLPTQVFLIVGFVAGWGVIAALLTYSFFAFRDGEREMEQMLADLGGPLEAPAGSPVVAAVPDPPLTPA